MENINWVSAFAAAIASFGLGALWYSQRVFGAAWLKAADLNREDATNPGIPMSVSAFSCVISAIIIAVLAAGLGVNSVVGGLALGAMLGVGLIAPAMLSDYLFCQLNTRLWLIQAGYRAAYCILSGAIIGGWPA